MTERNSPDDKYKKNLIREYRFWTIYLHEDQRYLGRAYAWLRRHVDKHDLFDLHPQEECELNRIVRTYKCAVDKLWKPDLWNYAWLGNEIKVHGGHGHMHLIPRYKAPRAFCGVEFADQRWGKNYASYEKFPVEQKVHGAIHDAIVLAHFI